MTDQPTEPSVSAVHDAPRPLVADRAAFQAELDRLRVREKAHTREGDAIAAARRRLPMVEIDPRTPLIGADGPVPLTDIFDGRSQLIAYFHMWHTGRPAAEQCEGCTFSTSHVSELSYLHSRDVSYAVFGEGPYAEISRYRDFMGYSAPWYSVPPDSVDRLVADRHFGILVSYLRDGDRVFETYWTTGHGDEVMAPSYGLLDLTAYGRRRRARCVPDGFVVDRPSCSAACLLSSSAMTCCRSVPPYRYTVVARVVECPIRSISSRRFAPASAASMYPVWRRS